MRVSASNERTWALPAPDTYPAVCIRQIDLGTQENKQYGKLQRKIKFVWELIGTSNIFDEAKGPQPFIVSKEYTVSFGDQANLRKDVESWINRSLTEAELEDFDLAMLLGKPAFVTISHSDDGKYANINSVTAPIKGFAINPPENEIFEFNLGAIGWEQLFEKLFDGEKKKIMASPEYKELAADAPVAQVPKATTPKQQAMPSRPAQAKIPTQAKPAVTHLGEPLDPMSF